MYKNTETTFEFSCIRVFAIAQTNLVYLFSFLNLTFCFYNTILQLFFRIFRLRADPGQGHFRRQKRGGRDMHAGVC